MRITLLSNGLNTLSLFLFVITLDYVYVLRTSPDTHNKLRLTLSKQRSWRYPDKKKSLIADYAEDQALIVGAVANTMKLIHSLEKAAQNVGLYVNTKRDQICQI